MPSPRFIGVPMDRYNPDITSTIDLVGVFLWRFYPGAHLNECLFLGAFLPTRLSGYNMTSHFSMDKFRDHHTSASKSSYK